MKENAYACTVTAPKQSIIASLLRMLHGTCTPQDLRRQAVEGGQKGANLTRMIRAPQEPEIWAAGSLMAIDLQRLERELVGKPSSSGSPSELSRRGEVHLPNGS